MSLLDRLKLLLPGQLQEVTHQYGMPAEYIRTNVAPVEQAMDLHRYAQQQGEAGLNKLAGIVDKVMAPPLPDEPHPPVGTDCTPALAAVTEIIKPSPLPKTSRRVVDESPFSYGKPVSPEDFIGRSDKIHAILSRLYKIESSMIIGRTQSGKTSLLNKVIHELTHDPHLQHIVVIRLDVLMATWTPLEFWNVVIARLVKQQPQFGLPTRLTEISYLDLKDVFDILYDHQYSCVLIIDDFEQLVFHQHLFSEEFLLPLRSVSQTGQGLSLLLTSRLSLEEIHDKARSFWQLGSAFFSHVQPISLGLFSEKSVSDLLKKGKKIFHNRYAKDSIKIAGRHPFLLQALASQFYTAFRQKNYTEEKSVDAFYEIAQVFFDGVWQGLDNTSRAALFIVYILEEGSMVAGKSFDLRGELDKHPSAIRTLKQHGLIDSLAHTGRDKAPVIIEGEPYGLGGEALNWWLGDRLVHLYHTEASPEDVLQKEVVFFMKRETREYLTSVLRQINLDVLLQHAKTAKSLWKLTGA